MSMLKKLKKMRLVSKNNATASPGSNPYAVSHCHRKSPRENRKLEETGNP
jgi:hypothetical protein